MDNLAFQNDEGAPTRSVKKPLTRANSTLTPTNKSWHLTQAPHPSKLCRYNSVIVPKNCCEDKVEDNMDSPASLDYPFFAKKSPAKNILTNNSLWTKEFWSDNYNRLHDSSPVFQKFPSNKSDVSTIYDPQFLSSKFGYSGSHLSISNNEMKKEWWPGGWYWETVQRKNIASSKKVAAILCALVLTLLASGNVIYILKTVEKPVESPNKGTWVDVVLISGEFRITNEPYRLALANHTSDHFQQLSSLISHQLDSLFSLSVISEPYHSTAVTELLPDLLVRCQIILRAMAQLTASKVGLAFISGLRNQHGHVWLGNFSVDIQSIGFQASGDAVSWTAWSSWGDCQQTQEFGYVQVRSRNCTLRSGQYLYSTLPCLLVPNSHGNIETTPCLPQFTPQEYDAMDTAESNPVLNHVNNNTAHSEKMVMITREDCESKNEIVEEVPISSSSPVPITTEQPIKNESVQCVCAKGEVCVALQEKSVPQCLSILDSTDPTGCGGHCKINIQHCQRIQDNAFRCIDDTKCLEDEWQCSNKLCIPQSKRCDGQFNCYDHTDEYNCDENVPCMCAKGEVCVALQEKSGPQCLPVLDKKDPTGCGGHCKINIQHCQRIQDNAFRCVDDSKCLEDEWQCGNKLCIPQSKRCDGQFNCYDHTDEYNCDESVACLCAKGEVCVALQEKSAPHCLPVFNTRDPSGCGGYCKINIQHCQRIENNAFRCVDDSKCLEDEWQCGDKLCIPQSKRCDGQFNCYDHTDEYNCDESVPCTCAKGEVCVALQEKSAPQCLSVLDTTDPTGCGGHCKINTQHCQRIHDNAFRCVDDTKCLEDEWQCGNKLCIPQSKRCDGHFNCYDHTDEYNCDCLGAEQFTCNDSQCIPNHRFCDGFADCKDHSDEPFGCGGECKTHEWRCSNSRCIPQSKRCDGVDDCGNNSDEAECPNVTSE